MSIEPSEMQDKEPVIVYYYTDARGRQYGSINSDKIYAMSNGLKVEQTYIHYFHGHLMSTTYY